MSSNSAPSSALPPVGPVTLEPNFSNSQQFVQSMFTGVDRTANVVFDNQATPHAIKIGDELTVDVYFGSFINEASLHTMVNSFYAAWVEKWQGYLQPSDYNLIQALAGYVKANCPVMWIPRIVFDKSLPVDGKDSGTPPIYWLNGYDPVPLMDEQEVWNETGVKLFLKLFVYGAHIVPMQQPLYGPAPDFDDFMQSITAALGSSLFRGVDDSHYATIVATTGEAYPALFKGDQVPPNTPLICSFLMGPTVQSGSSRECFMQLEGWQSFSTISSTIISYIEHLVLLGLIGVAIKVIEDLSETSWHMKDYGIYGETLWNFSTYGACAYSEKRATTIFLSGRKWPAKTSPASVMAPYKGAYPMQGWLLPNLVAVHGFTEPNPMASVVSNASNTLGSYSTAPFMFDQTIANMPSDSSLYVAISGNSNSANIKVDISIGNATTELMDGSTFAISNVNSSSTYQIHSPQNANGASFVVTFLQQAAAA